MLRISVLRAEDPQNRWPSYYLEGLLYNVPAEKFTDSYGQCFVNVVNWFQELTDAQKEQLVCANEQYYLLRDNFHVCWPKTHADKFVSAAVDLWNEWSD